MADLLDFGNPGGLITEKTPTTS